MVHGCLYLFLPIGVLIVGYGGELQLVYDGTASLFQRLFFQRASVYSGISCLAWLATTAAVHLCYWVMYKVSVLNICLVFGSADL